MKKENKLKPYFTTTNVTIHPNRDDEEMEGIGDKAIKIGLALLAWLVLVTISPVLILVFGTLLIWKWGVVWVIVKLFKRKFIKGFSSCESVFAVDRFWESSRSSLGLIVELEGSIDVDKFREEFRQKILEYSPTALESEPEPAAVAPGTDNSDNDNDNEVPKPEDTESQPAPDTPATPTPIAEPPRPFAKLTQVPVTFYGYYYWQKAKYFLIHEHIRQINQPTDELGLKKAASTLMSLPFPNRRPLWEILVYPNYLGTTTVGRGTTCGSALFMRVHHSLTDSKGLMNILQRMMLDGEEKSCLSVKVISEPGKVEDSAPASSSQAMDEQPAEVEAKGITVIRGVCNLIMDKFTSLVFLPLKTFQFTYRVIRVPDGIATLTDEEQTDSANASWAPLPDILIRKICSSQSPPVSRSVVEMSLFLEGITSRSKHKCLNVPEEKGAPSQQGKCQTCVLIPVPANEEKVADQPLSNTKSFVTVKCACQSSLQTTANKTTLLKSIQTQFQRNGVDCKRHRQVVKIYLRLLSLLPRQVLRYLIMSKRWGAGCFIYEQFQMDLTREEMDKDERKVFGQHRVSQIVPLVGLQWTHTLASAASLQWQDGTVVMSLIANAGILGPVSQGNPQDHAERIVKGFPEELERLSDDAEDHGFVSIPIS